MRKENNKGNMERVIKEIEGMRKQIEKLCT